MTKLVRLVILRIICLPSDIIAHAIVLAVHALWGQRLIFSNGILCTELDANSWPSRTWYREWGATTFGHAVMFANGFLDNVKTFQHELVHVEQFESASVQALFIAGAFWSLGAPRLAIALLMINAFLNYAASVITAILRGEASGYRGSHLEEAAYKKEVGESEVDK